MKDDTSSEADRSHKYLKSAHHPPLKFSVLVKDIQSGHRPPHRCRDELGRVGRVGVLRLSAPLEVPGLSMLRPCCKKVALLQSCAMCAVYNNYDTRCMLVHGAITHISQNQNLKLGRGRAMTRPPPNQTNLFQPQNSKTGGWAMNPLTRLKPKTLCNWGMRDDPIDTIKLNNSEIERVMALLI